MSHPVPDTELCDSAHAIMFPPLAVCREEHNDEQWEDPEPTIVHAFTCTIPEPTMAHAFTCTMGIRLSV